jgi:hypothetical protein
MDKLKPYLAVVKKYHFWVVCGATLLIGLVCWWMATSGLAGQFQRHKSRIVGSFDSVKKIQAGHPNEKLIADIKAQHEQLKRNVFGAWEILYKEQKEKNPFPTAVLGEDFQKIFENLGPKDEIPRRYRERYQNFIKDHLPDLTRIIDMLQPVTPDPNSQLGAAPGAAPGIRPPSGMMPGTGGYGSGTETEWKGVVDWNQTDYAKFEARFIWQQTPSTLAVTLAQEDLWVYEALLRAIKNTNGDAKTQDKAVIKRIDALEIGREAAAAWQSSAAPLFTQAGGAGGLPGAEGMPGAPPGPGGLPPSPGGMGNPAMMPGGTPGSGGAATGPASEEQLNKALMECRYIDDKGQPLLYQAEYPFAKHPYAEFKMMPIRMLLTMDQRELPRLLVHCANSNMPIEVRRVRLLKTQSTASSLGGSSGGGGPGGMGMGMPPMPGGGMGIGAPPMPGGGMLGGGLPGRAAGEAGQETGPFDFPVEIQAVIYIYNPPDREKLGTGAAAAENPPAPTPPATPPTGQGV